MYVFFLLPFSLKGLLFLSGDTSNNLICKTISLNLRQLWVIVILQKIGQDETAAIYDEFMFNPVPDIVWNMVAGDIKT